MRLLMSDTSYQVAFNIVYMYNDGIGGVEMPARMKISESRLAELAEYRKTKLSLLQNPRKRASESFGNKG